jgi:hypothetical protein
MRLALPTYRLTVATEDESVVHAVIRVVAGVACMYEGFALVASHVPTLSAFCQRHRWFECLLLGWLVLHLHYLRKVSSPGGVLRLSVAVELRVLPSVKMFWWNSRPNFGDAIAPLLLRKFASLEAEWDTPGRASVVTVGSVLEAMPALWDGYVLGSGKLYPDSRLNLYGPRINVLALRGPLTARSWAGNCAIGDPGLLADELLSEPPERVYDLGIIPHWSDLRLAHDQRFYGKWSTVVIHPSGDPLEVIWKIGQCRKVVSSSLHGLIAADAFGIPRRFEYTPRFDREGKDFKFRDYNASIGMKTETCVTQRANRHLVEDRKSELWDAYRMLGKLLGGIS